MRYQSRESRESRESRASRESKDVPRVWIVEAVDLADDESPSSVQFLGFEARERAEAYAAEKNAALCSDAVR